MVLQTREELIVNGHEHSDWQNHGYLDAGGSSAVAVIFFLAGFLPNVLHNARRIYREKRRVPIVHDDAIKPQGEYRLHD